MDLIYELLQTPHGMMEMEEPLRNYLSTEKPINTHCSEKELSTQTETGIVKSVAHIWKGFFFFFGHFQLELKPQLLGKSCFIFSFSAPSIPQRFHHQFNEFQLSRELIRSVICLFLFPSLNKQEKCF